MHEDKNYDQMQIMMEKAIAYKASQEQKSQEYMKNQEQHYSDSDVELNEDIENKHVETKHEHIAVQENEDKSDTFSRESKGDKSEDSES